MKCYACDAVIPSGDVRDLMRHYHDAHDMKTLPEIAADTFELIGEDGGPLEAFAKSVGMREEPGWHGALTRNEQPGAIPNGTRVVKVACDVGDRRPIGCKGTVLGSLPRDPSGEHGYFVEWEDLPRTAVLVMGWKVKARQ